MLIASEGAIHIYPVVALYCWAIQYVRRPPTHKCCCPDSLLLSFLSSTFGLPIKLADQAGVPIHELLDRPPYTCSRHVSLARIQCMQLPRTRPAAVEYPTLHGRIVCTYRMIE